MQVGFRNKRTGAPGGGGEEGEGGAVSSKKEVKITQRVIFICRRWVREYLWKDFPFLTIFGWS